MRSILRLAGIRVTMIMLQRFCLAPHGERAKRTGERAKRTIDDVAMLYEIAYLHDGIWQGAWRELPGATNVPEVRVA
jgi:hypothetical protein